MLVAAIGIAAGAIQAGALEEVTVTATSAE